jgi:hypothetical protein
MEMAEGVPEFLGIASAMDIGVISAEQVRKYIEVSTVHMAQSIYYSLGMLQILALKQFSGEPIAEISADLAGSTSVDDNIFEKFQKTFDR